MHVKKYILNLEHWTPLSQQSLAGTPVSITEDQPSSLLELLSSTYSSISASLFFLELTKHIPFFGLLALAACSKFKHSSPNSYGYYLQSFKNLLKCYFLKLPYSILLKIAIWPPYHRGYVPITLLFFHCIITF